MLPSALFPPSISFLIGYLNHGTREIGCVKKCLNLVSFGCLLSTYTTQKTCTLNSGGFRGGGGQGAIALGLALFMPKKGLALLPPPPCICQNVQKSSVRCLKVVPGVPKMVLIRSKSKKYPPIYLKAACKICPKVIPDGPKMA